MSKLTALVNFLSYIFLVANVSATQAEVNLITIDSGHRLGPSTVSKYMAINNVDYDDKNYPLVEKALVNLDMKHMRMFGPLDSSVPGGLIPVARLDDNISLDFKVYDQHLDFIRTVFRVRPLINLAYMPKAISSRPDVNNYRAYPPRNWKFWHDVVFKLVKRNVEKNFSGLYYEVWNEPEISCPECEWQGSYEEYVRLYTEAAKAVKAADPAAKIGGPAPSHWANPWRGRSSRTHTWPFIKDFLSSIKQYNINNPASPVAVDFISWHHYSPNYLSVSHGEVKRYVSEVGFPATPEYVVTEWNSEYSITTHPWHLKASFAVANLIQQALSREVWPFWFTFRVPKSRDFATDYNSGLIANNNINCKRPTYAAFQMMNAMTTGNFVSTSSPPELAVMATTDDKASKLNAVIANYNPTNNSATVSFKNLPFTKLSVKRKIQWIDKARSMGCGGLEAGTVTQIPVRNNSLSFDLTFPAYSVVLITLTS